MTRRTITTLILAGAIALLCSGGSVDENAPDAADWQSFSDDKVLEYLDNPYSGVRLYAGQEILRRWDEKKIIALCEKNWKRGCEVLNSGAWPNGGGEVTRYLLACGEGDNATDNGGDAAYLLAIRDTVPDGPGYGTRVGGQCRDIWFTNWITRIPQYTFFSGTIDFIVPRSWCRERLFRDDDWVSTWGAYRRDDGTWYYPWRLVEYRHVVAILCGDGAHVDQSHINTNHFLQVLQKCVETGKNHADVPMVAGEPANMSDRLTSSISISGVGTITYAELLAVVMNRADWVPAIEARLAVSERVVLAPKFRNGVPDGVVKTVTRYDDRSPLIAMTADVGDHRWDAAKAGLRAYWRREWRGYSDTTFRDDLWLRHPWLSAGVLDKGFSAWYGGETKPFVGEPDVAFLRGEWR